MFVTPIAGLYLVYLRCRPFIFGILSGCFIAVSLVTWLQSILWADQHLKMLTLSHSNELLNYGVSESSNYEINKTVMLRTLLMSILCAVTACIDSITTLILLLKRHQYSVDVIKSNNLGRPYQAIVMTETGSETFE